MHARASTFKTRRPIVLPLINILHPNWRAVRLSGVSHIRLPLLPVGQRDERPMSNSPGLNTSTYWHSGRCIAFVWFSVSLSVLWHARSSKSWGSTSPDILPASARPRPSIFDAGRALPGTIGVVSDSERLPIDWCSFPLTAGAVTHQRLLSVAAREQRHLFTLHPQGLPPEIQVHFMLPQVVHLKRACQLSVGDKHRQLLLASHADTGLHWSLERKTMACHSTQSLLRYLKSRCVHAVTPGECLLRPRIHQEAARFPIYPAIKLRRLPLLYRCNFFTSTVYVQTCLFPQCLPVAVELL
ncbi:hypothetical protein E2C01_015133 [Portunus trituberculatus]|uniref:Uncharacterized protein n=1 Tax=Portunus trituberculatus TaxID=210409 RepID=A0A5B7DMB9_PORTR|nr:hypothetical protein [Portunus trituberculatus]